MSPSLIARSAARLVSVARSPFACGIAAAVVVSVASSAARAEYVNVIDLSQPNTAPIEYQGAVFGQSSLQPTGTGVFDPFVRIQQKGTEAGYNTDARPLQSGFQTKDENHWNHSLPLSNLVPVVYQGKTYYEFTLDINEEGSATKSLLSMQEFEVYLGNSPTLNNYQYGSGFGSDAKLVYDLDAGIKGNKPVDARVELDAKLNPPGSGVADLVVLIPTELFNKGPQYQYVYLFSGFGNPNPSGAGFEEWAAKAVVDQNPNPNPVPAPAGLVLGAIGFGGCLLGRRFRTRTAAQA